jgi:hypothetical protein
MGRDLYGAWRAKGNLDGLTEPDFLQLVVQVAG